LAVFFLLERLLLWRKAYVNEKLFKCIQM
jgi:hypothetical protein